MDKEEDVDMEAATEQKQVNQEMVQKMNSTIMKRAKTLPVKIIRQQKRRMKSQLRMRHVRKPTSPLNKLVNLERVPSP